MRKILFMGRSECGKTSLTQAMRGETITYHKTQYVNAFDVIIDTPGEYAECSRLAKALAIYSCEADVIGLLISAIEPYSLYPPCVTAVSTREVIGIVTKIDHRNANPRQAARWLRLAGCTKIFYISSYSGEGIPELLEYLKEDGDVLPWEEAKAQQQGLRMKKGGTKDYSSENLDDMIDNDFEHRKRTFAHVDVGDDVLGREITADGQSVKATKDVPAQIGVKFKSEIDELEEEKDEKMAKAGIEKPMEAAGIKEAKRAERLRKM
ncbi:MAG: EutP/PduV family microcompartment system protein [Anaerovoracaceae bacterium]|nr:EutP/PduV family microcompartment system protein [Anaerovoracaceae bacterium]